jgi:hypothetical protein
VSVLSGEDGSELLRNAVSKLDAAYAANPLPGS